MSIKPLISFQNSSKLQTKCYVFQVLQSIDEYRIRHTRDVVWKGANVLSYMCVEIDKVVVVVCTIALNTRKL